MCEFILELTVSLCGLYHFAELGYLPIASAPMTSAASISPNSYSPPGETASEIGHVVTVSGASSQHAVGIRRAGHFLAHGSGAADKTTPTNQRPDANTQPAPHEATAAATHRIVPPRSPAPPLSTHGCIASLNNVNNSRSSCSVSTPTASKFTCSIIKQVVSPRLIGNIYAQRHRNCMQLFGRPTLEIILFFCDPVSISS